MQENFSPRSYGSASIKRVKANMKTRIRENTIIDYIKAKS